jgi:hypothetical protein
LTFSTFILSHDLTNEFIKKIFVKKITPHYKKMQENLHSYINFY